MEFRILGPLEIIGPDGPVELRSAKLRSLLGLLLIRADEVVSAERLIDDLWEGAPPRSAAGTLQTYVSQLRKQLNPTVVQSMPGGYRVTLEDHRLDAVEFETALDNRAHTSTDRASDTERLRAALELWRGAALADFVGAHWAAAEAARLDGLRQIAAEDLVESRLALGEHARLVPELEAAIAAHPLQERPWAQLMVALYRCGRQADALRAYGRLRTHLGEELGIEPSTELAQLEQAILLQVPELGGPSVARPVVAVDPIGPKSVTPSGTVTLLFTDIEGSTSAWEAHPVEMQGALARHDLLLRSVIEASGGYVFKTVGDAFCAAFTDAGSAIRAAVEVQKAVAVEPWPALTPIGVRIAAHTGACDERDGDYFGPTVNRIARLLAIGHGGQILLSGITAQLARERLPVTVSLRDLGDHRLKDLSAPEKVSQVVIDGLDNDFPPLRSLSNPLLQTNIGIQPSTFIGRRREIRAVRELVKTNRLVTIVGPGGAGKTRLAIQTAVELLDGSGDGVWLVELAPVSDPDRVASTVARVLGILEDPTRSTAEHLVDVCADRDTLIVFDNCEHVIDTVAKLADQLLRHCPNVELLATSREPLNIDGEQIYRLGALALPETAETDVDTIASCEAVQLFVDRAQRHSPTFALTDKSAPIVASICRRVDGLPLAIELAAARLTSMPLEGLEARLDQRFRLLTGGSRTADARQQTLQALIDWSWNLLTAAEQTSLARLGVFNGTFALDAAETIITNGTQTEAWDAFDLLGALVAKSLVHTTRTGRYQLLETIRAYLAARLDADQAKRARQIHRGHYLKLANEAQHHFRTKDEDSWFERLDADLDNLTAAIDTSLSDDEPITGLQLATSLLDYWDLRGQYTYAADRVARLHDQAGTGIPPVLHCWALITLTRLHSRLGEYRAARQHCNDAVLLARSLDDRALLVRALTAPGAIIDSPDAAVVAFSEALALARSLDDERFIATALSATALALMVAGRASEGRGLIDEALQIYVRLGYQNGIANTLGIMAGTNAASGDLATARQQYERALDIYVDHPSASSEPTAQFQLGLIIHAQGHREEAWAHFVESLALARRTGSHNDVACALFGLAITEPEPRRAAMLHGAADTILEENDVALDPFEAEYRTADHARLRALLGDATFDEHHERGRAMPRAQAINLALTATNAT